MMRYHGYPKATLHQWSLASRLFTWQSLLPDTHAIFCKYLYKQEYSFITAHFQSEDAHIIDAL
jgi:hypothetical protein